MALLKWLSFIFLLSSLLLDPIYSITCNHPTYPRKFKWTGLSESEHCLIQCDPFDETRNKPQHMSCLDDEVYACFQEHGHTQDEVYPEIHSIVSGKNVVCEKPTNRVRLFPILGKCNKDDVNSNAKCDFTRYYQRGETNPARLYVELKELLKDPQFHWNYMNNGEEKGKALWIPKDLFGVATEIRFATRDEYAFDEPQDRKWKQIELPDSFGKFLKNPMNKQHTKFIATQKSKKTEYVFVRRRVFDRKVSTWHVVDMVVNHHAKTMIPKTKGKSKAQYHRERLQFRKENMPNRLKDDWDQQGFHKQSKKEYKKEDEKRKHQQMKKAQRVKKEEKQRKKIKSAKIKSAGKRKGKKTEKMVEKTFKKHRIHTKEKSVSDSRSKTTPQKYDHELLREPSHSRSYSDFDPSQVANPKNLKRKKSKPESSPKLADKSRRKKKTEILDPKTKDLHDNKVTLQQYMQKHVEKDVQHKIPTDEQQHDIMNDIWKEETGKLQSNADFGYDAVYGYDVYDNDIDVSGSKQSMMIWNVEFGILIGLLLMLLSMMTCMFGLMVGLKFIVNK